MTGPRTSRWPNVLLLVSTLLTWTSCLAMPLWLPADPSLRVFTHQEPSVLAVPDEDEAWDGIHVERQAYVMGTRVLLATGAVSRPAGLGVLERMLDVIESTEAELSTWRDTSLLGQLNSHPVGKPFAAPSWLCGLLEELRYWHHETNGAFDPVIGSLVEAWDLRGSGRIPSLEERKSAQLRTGINLFGFQSSPCVVIRRSDATIDAGAFGKGLALDRLRDTEFGLGEKWLADLGGQVAVGSGSSRTRQVALAHPVERDRAVVEVRLERGSLAVSGGSERDRRVNDVPVGHILDPRTGRPVSREFSVAVWHPRALVADILATALYVMGADEGLAWAEARGLAACFLLPVTAEESSTALDGIEISATVAFTRRFL